MIIPNTSIIFVDFSVLMRGTPFKPLCKQYYVNQPYKKAVLKPFLSESLVTLYRDLVKQDLPLLHSTIGKLRLNKCSFKRYC